MEINKRPIYINITSMTIVKIILIGILFYFFYLVKDILAVLFISLILASAIDPWVDWMQKRKIPRAFGVVIIYLGLFIVVSSVIYLVIPPIIEQIRELSASFPQILEKIVTGFSALKDFSAQYGLLESVKENLGTISSNLQGAAGGVFSTVSGIFGGIFTFFLVLVITFYMVVEENAMKKIVWSVVPEEHQVRTMTLVNRMQKKVGLWLRGQLILSLIIFALVYIGLLILGVKYALVLALLAGLTEFVPYLGPVLGAIPAVFLSFTQSPMLALFVAVLFYVVQLTENNIIVPKLMQKVVGLNPIISIAVLMVGFQIAGIVGAILSIPVATATSVLVKDIFDNKAVEKENGADFEK
ncbi:MAG: AI-2E family transporter [Planctomycetes bacterium]|jgi:predicted PurR-regulated permease PerM|nr:AI-2E family transporter [Planctomycetota bacterium]